jgi:hypothetical protein
MAGNSSPTSITGLMPSLELIDTHASTKPLQEDQHGGGGGGGESATQRLEYRVYKRRFFGLAQLVLLNIVINWDVRLLHSFVSSE